MTDMNALRANDEELTVDADKFDDLMYAAFHFEDLIDALHTTIGALPEFGEPMPGRKKTALHGLCASFSEISERMQIALQEMSPPEANQPKLN